MTSSPAAGWFNDPNGLPQLRWWNGQAWGDQTRASLPGGEAPGYYAVPGVSAVLEPKNGAATASVILGIVASVLVILLFLLAVAVGPTPGAMLLAAVFGGIPGVLAIIFGFTGRRAARQFDGLGRARSNWGIALGFLPGLPVVAVLVALVILLSNGR